MNEDFSEMDFSWAAQLMDPWIHRININDDNALP